MKNIVLIDIKTDKRTIYNSERQVAFHIGKNHDYISRKIRQKIYNNKKFMWVPEELYDNISIKELFNKL